MIRIPSPSASGSSSLNHQTDAMPEPARNVTASALESRLHLLEETLGHHAEDLKANVAERSERIESRFDRAIGLLAKEEGEEADREKIIEFAADSIQTPELPASAALNALHELNETILLTREHLEALGCSVAQMKRSLAG